MRSNLAKLMAIGLRLSAVGAIAGLGIVALCESALALANWQFDADREQLVISVPKGVTPQYYLMAEPARIVLDLPNTEAGAAREQSYGGAVRQIRIAQFQPGMTRIVLELSPNAVLAPGQVELKPIPEEGAALQRWTLRPLLAGAAPDSEAPVLPVPAPAMPLAQAPSPAADSLPPLESGAIEIPVEAAAVPAAPIAAAPAPSSAIPAAAPAPIQIDFATPLPATPADLATPGSSAAGLSSTSAQAARPRAASPAAPAAASGGGSFGGGSFGRGSFGTSSSSARSFPVPTADGISVPDLTTVIANAAEDGNSGDGNSGAANPSDATPDSAASANPPSSADLPKAAEAAEAVAPTNPAQPRLTARQRRAAQAAQSAEAQPEAQPETQPETSPDAAGAVQIIPFGQPLPR